MSPQYFDEKEVRRMAHQLAMEMNDERIAQVPDSDGTQWHLDRKVPLAIIFAFVVQTVTLVVIGTAWKTDIDNRVQQLEKSDNERRPQESRIVIVEQQLKYIAESLTRIEAKLDNKSDRQRMP
jgi:hypothetical protein